MLSWLLITAGAPGLIASEIESPDGVIVEEDCTRSALHKIGLKAGDIVLAWEKLSRSSSLEPAKGSIDSIFDWLWLNIEEVPRGGLKLVVRRNGLMQVFQVPEGHWDAKIRPAMDGDILKSFLITRELAESGQSPQAADSLARLIELARSRSQSSLSYWLSLQASNHWASRGDWSKANKVQIVALEGVDGARDQALAWLNIGDLRRDQEDFGTALDAYHKAKRLSEIFQRNSLLATKADHEIANILRLQGSVKLAEESSLKTLHIQQELAPNSVPVALSLDNLAMLSRSKGDLNTAKQYETRALEILERLAPDSSELARGLNTMGSILLSAGDLESAEKQLNRSLDIRRVFPSERQGIAIVLNQLALLAERRGDLRLSERLQEEALAGFRKINPESTAVATALGNLGVLAWRLGNFDAALQHYQEALALQRRLAPDGLDAARTLSNLSALLRGRGDFEGAQNSLNRARLIISKAAPNSTTHARILHNLGLLAYSRGDLELAKDYYQGALAIFQAIDPSSRDLATIMNNLGAVATGSLDLELAEDYYGKALKLAQTIRPDSREAAGALLNLGTIAYERERFSVAEDYYSKALLMYQKGEPDSHHITDCLHNLGNVSSAMGNIEQAVKYYEQALKILEASEPESINVASEFHSLGVSARKKGDLDQALVFERKALAILERLAPGSTKEALCRASIAQISYSQGKIGVAIDYLYRAIESLEHQVAKLSDQGGSRLEYRTKYKGFYSTLIEILIQENRAEEAFAVFERSRARGLLEMLTYRDLTIGEVPSELAAEMRRVEIAYDKIQQGILTGKTDSRGSEAQLADSRRLMREREEVASKIRRASPKFAALKYPEPFDLAGVRGALGPGTVMLAYDVSEEQTTLFIINSERLVSASLIKIGRDELDREISLMRGLIDKVHGSAGSDPVRSKSLQTISMRLYEQLVGPAVETVKISKRILILPDGPLHLLPYGALIVTGEKEDGEADPRPTYLTEWKPIHSIISGTLYSELKNTGSAQTIGLRAPSIGAFGDPALPPNLISANAIADVRVRLVLDRGFGFEALPAARDEVGRIAALFPEHAILFLGADASEGRAKSLPKTMRYVHFATHTILDGRFPLNTAIVLTIPEHFEEGYDNGLLQTWEILEKVRLDADLVVLSACESGLGKEMGGEGLIGLTRAFQYAGARSVMASLWKISDRTTAEFMVRFYRHLKEGLSKDEALRATQIELIRGPIQVTSGEGERVEFDASAPYYWAAFQIYGDWQ